VTGFWATLPADRVVHLRGASSEAVALALEPLPDGSPAVVTYYPGHPTSLPDAVTGLLAKLDGLAMQLFRAWLPEADGIEASGSVAVREMAMRKAADAGYFGPFLVDLAMRALNGQQGEPPRLTAEVRAAGLVRILAESCGRDRLAIVVYPSMDLSPDALDALVAAGEWFVRHGPTGVWLTGECWMAIDRVSRISVQLPRELAFVDASTPNVPTLPVPPAVTFPAVRGRPRADSQAERALEAALARQPWARGRSWNETYQPDPLTPAIAVDLIWRDERCVVEIDGPEHRSLLQFEADRRRDVRLQLDGYAVLRFTNAQIQYDLALVQGQLEQFITSRRKLRTERLAHV
jgi:very-short-patch-repair endonuclease